MMMIRFHYAEIIALNLQKIEPHPEIKPFIKLLIKNFNWQGISYPLKTEDWKTFERII